MAASDFTSLIEEFAKHQFNVGHSTGRGAGARARADKVEADLAKAKLLKAISEAVDDKVLKHGIRKYTNGTLDLLAKLRKEVEEGDLGRERSPTMIRAKVQEGLRNIMEYAQQILVWLGSSHEAVLDTAESRAEAIIKTVKRWGKEDKK